MPAIAYELPELPYDYDALEPHIDAETLRIHHDQHHRRYANDLNEVLADYPGLANHSIEALLWNLDRVPEEIYPLARFYGGGCANHQLFWKVMAPALAAADAPTGALADAIDEAFGGLDAFVEAFTDAALSVFGSGWAFLTTDEEGTLRIEATANNDNPLTDGRGALFVLDCWEHAYYLSYRHRRDEYVEAWWNVLDWATADDRYDRIPESIERFDRERH